MPAAAVAVVGFTVIEASAPAVNETEAVSVSGCASEVSIAL